MKVREDNLVALDWKKSGEAITGKRTIRLNILKAPLTLNAIGIRLKKENPEFDPTEVKIYARAHNLSPELEHEVHPEFDYLQLVHTEKLNIKNRVETKVIMLPMRNLITYGLHLEFSCKEDEDVTSANIELYF